MLARKLKETQHVTKALKHSVVHLFTIIDSIQHGHPQVSDQLFWSLEYGGSDHRHLGSPDSTAPHLKMGRGEVSVELSELK